MRKEYLIPIKNKDTSKSLKYLKAIYETAKMNDDITNTNRTIKRIFLNKKIIEKTNE